MAIIVTDAGEKELAQRLTEAAKMTDFEPGPEESYSSTELYWWVKLLCKQAGNKREPASINRSLLLAAKYLAMARAKLSTLREDYTQTVQAVQLSEHPDNPSATSRQAHLLAEAEVDVGCATTLYRSTLANLTTKKQPPTRIAIRAVPQADETESKVSEAA